MLLTWQMYHQSVLRGQHARLTFAKRNVDRNCNRAEQNTHIFIGILNQIKATIVLHSVHGGFMSLSSENIVLNVMIANKK